jgi:hypothetical protein
VQITCTRDGYEPTTEIVDSKFSGATVGNVLLGGLIGIAVDAASGANNNYPERILIVMTPESFPDAVARDEHFTKVTDRIKESAAREVKTIQDRCSSTQRELCQIDVKRIEDARDRALAGIEQKRAAAKVAGAVSSRRGAVDRHAGHSCRQPRARGGVQPPCGHHLCPGSSARLQDRLEDGMVGC